MSGQSWAALERRKWWAGHTVGLLHASSKHQTAVQDVETVKTCSQTCADGLRRSRCLPVAHWRSLAHLSSQQPCSFTKQRLQKPEGAARVLYGSKDSTAHAVEASTNLRGMRRPVSTVCQVGPGLATWNDPLGAWAASAPLARPLAALASPCAWLHLQDAAAGRVARGQ